MTLLSIREQEAVKEARMALSRAAYARSDRGQTEAQAVESSHAYSAAVDALILATRDAIARQVREKATPSSVLSDEWLEIATFIEGISL